MHDLQRIRILIVDHHVIVGSGLSAILEEYPDFDIVGKAQSGDEFLRLMGHCRPDIVTIDIELPGQINGPEAIRIARHRLPETRVVILTNVLDEIVIRDALQLGVSSYLLKNTSASDLAQAIRSAYHGIPTLSPEVTKLVIREIATPSHNGHGLTPREYQVLELVARGLNNQEIAAELSVSLSTVQFHVSNILNKLGVHNRIEAATFAIRHGLTG